MYSWDNFILLFFIIGLAVLGRYITHRVSADDRNKYFLKSLFLMSFIVRVILVFLFFFGSRKIFKTDARLSYGFMNDDGILYDQFGWQIAQAWRSGYNPSPITIIGSRTPGYFYSTAFIYFLFGHNTLFVRVFNSFLGAIIPVFVYHISKYSYHNKVSRLASLIVAFLPSQLIFSIDHMKDISITFLIIFIIWALIRLDKKFSYRILLIACLMFAYLTCLRPEYAIVLSLTIVFYYLLNTWLIKSRTRVAIIWTFGTVSISALAFSIGYNLGGLEFIQQGVQRFLYSYTAYISTESPTSFYHVFQSGIKIYLIPVAILYVMATPFPLWPFLNPSGDPIQWIDLPASLAWYVLIPFSIYGILHAFDKRNRNSVSILLGVVVIVFILMLALSGEGLSAKGRYREPIMPLLMVFSSVGLVNFKRGYSVPRLILFGYTAFLSGVLMLYLYVKVL